jgi:hypothetical protein
LALNLRIKPRRRLKRHAPEPGVFQASCHH